MSAGDFGVNVIGFISGRLGLGVAARATVASFVRCGVPTACVDLVLPDGRSNADTTWAYLNISDATSLPHPVSIVHVNPLEAAGIWNTYPQFFEGKFNIIVPFWELSRVPQSWVSVLAEYDMVLAPSAHIAAAISGLCGVPVRRYPMGIQQVAADPAAGRERFGLAKNAFIFATSFDTGSGLSRKNAIGTIRAFDLAFEGQSDVQLVMKVSGPVRSPEFNAELKRMENSPRYRIITDHLPYPEVLGLYNACDAYLSLHRAEGLGLGLMEAMGLGKPVIATGWSGNMDFMDETNSCPVRYQLTPVVDRHAAYSSLRIEDVGLWAEPDLLHAVSLMRRVKTDAAFRAQIAAQARRSIETRNKAFFGGECVTAMKQSYLAHQWEHREKPVERQRIPA
jgi:hypothetical protein